MRREICKILPELAKIAHTALFEESAHHVMNISHGRITNERISSYLSSVEPAEHKASHQPEEWSRLGTNMVSDQIEGNLNRSISLSVDSNYVQQNSDALALLATLSLLPAGMSVRYLRW